MNTPEIDQINDTEREIDMRRRITAWQNQTINDLARERDEARGQRDRLAADLRIIADGTSCRECGGEDQARLAREALQSLFCEALQSLTNELSNQ